MRRGPAVTTQSDLCITRLDSTHVVEDDQVGDIERDLYNDWMVEHVVRETQRKLHWNIGRTSPNIFTTVG